MKKNKKKKKQFNLKELITSETFLKIVFALLLILVVILFIMTTNKKKEIANNPPANMVIPIYKDFSDYHFSISAEALAAGETYTLKITNYRDKTINKEDVNYTMTIDNSTSSKIKVFKKDDSTNLMSNQNKQLVDGSFIKAKKQEDTYYFKMTSHKEITDKDFIRVTVAKKSTEE